MINPPLSVTHLKCGCFFSGRIFNPVCEEHKPGDEVWNVFFDDLVDGRIVTRTYLGVNVTKEKAEEWAVIFTEKYVGKEYPNGQGRYQFHNVRVLLNPNREHPFCQEHKKPTDWQAIADNLLGQAKGEISVVKHGNGRGHSVLSSGLQPPTQQSCSNRPEG